MVQIPVDWSRYPDNWKEIAKGVKDRAGWKCEWCGTKHGDEIMSAKGRLYKAVMTVAHTTKNNGSKHDKHNINGLVCLCPRCHLRYDHEDHVENARKTREAKLDAIQPRLLQIASRKRKEQQMKLGLQKEYPLIPAGEHILKLVAIDTVEFPDKYGKGVDGKVTRLKWKFLSNETTDDGEPYDYVVFTGMEYGNESAGLTLLMDMIVPGITKDDFADFDTDDLIGKRFNSRIKHVKKDDGGMKAVHIFMTQIQPKAAGATKTKAAPTPEELDDPFEEGGEYQAAA